MNPSIDIHSWLQNIGLGELAPVFDENHITPDMLPNLTTDDFREMGITSLGQRKKLLAAIAGISLPQVLETPPSALEPQQISRPLPSQTQLEAEVPAPIQSPSAFSHLVQLKPATVRSAQIHHQEIAEIPVQPILPLPPQPQGRKSKRKGFSKGFLAVSIALHVILGLGAGYWVVQKIEATRKLQFASAPPTANPSKRALEHKVSLQKKKNAGGSPAQAHRIAVNGLAAKITLPDMPNITTSTQFVAGRMAGMGGAGFGSGLGFGNGSGMGVGGVGAGGLGLTMFGARGGAGLSGTFYDLKRDKEGKPTGVQQDRGLYNKVLKELTSGSVWKMPASVKCYVGKSKLVAKAFIFPAIQDTEAGKAFGEPETGPGMWIAHYSGTVKVPVSGKYRFVGWGVNLLAVRFGPKIVLDASDIGYLKSADNREARGNISFPRKNATPLLNGAWITMNAGSSVAMDVILGDEGGIYCAGLLLEKQGDSPGDGKGGMPNLPIFLAGPLSAAEQKLYDNYVSPKGLTGPVFNASAGATNPLDVLRR